MRAPIDRSWVAQRLVGGTMVVLWGCGGGVPAGPETESMFGSTGDDVGTTRGDVTDAGGSTTGPGESGSSSEGSDGSAGLPDNVQKLELRVDAFDIPAVETYYGCFEFTFSFDKLGHIVGFAPSIDQVPYVHHFVVTLIDGPTGNADGYTCFDLDGDMIWAWAPGQGEFLLPETAGYLVGDKPGGNVTVRLQVHYNNPLGDVGKIDSSGLDVLVTDELRANDAGTLVFGDVAGITIPPGEAAYEHLMRCRSEVTASQFEGPITVFGSSMHAHSLGSVLWTDVMRDGEKVMELNRDDPYDYGSQHIKFVDAILEPGDEIINHCIYDSTERDTVTVGGPGTQDEMCWDTIMYYPRISSGFDYCSSFD